MSQYKNFLHNKLVEFVNSWPIKDRTVGTRQLLIVEMGMYAAPDEGESLRDTFIGTVFGGPPKNVDYIVPDKTHNIVCLYIGRPGVISDVTIDDFMIMQFESYVQTPPVTVHELPLPNTLDDMLPTEIGRVLSQSQSFDINSFSLAKPPMDDVTDPSIWLYVPNQNGKGDTVPGGEGVPPLYRLRPLFKVVDREFKITLDDTTDPSERLGEFRSSLPFIFDHGTELEARMVMKTYNMPAQYSTQMMLYTDTDPSLSVRHIGTLSLSMYPDRISYSQWLTYANPELVSGDIWFEVSGPLPVGSVVDLIINVRYKEKLVTTDYIEVAEPQ